MLDNECCSTLAMSFSGWLFESRISGPTSEPSSEKKGRSYRGLLATVFVHGKPCCPSLFHCLPPFPPFFFLRLFLDGNGPKKRVGLFRNCPPRGPLLASKRGANIQQNRLATPFQWKLLSHRLQGRRAVSIFINRKHTEKNPCN